MPDELNKDDKGDGKSDGKIDVKDLPALIQTAVQTGISTAVDADRTRRQREELLAQANSQDDDDDDDVTDDKALEAMSRSELVDHIVKNVGKGIAKQLKGVSRDTESVRITAQKEKIIQQVTDAREKFPDFDEWKTEMLGRAKSHPDLTPEELYHIVRAEDPTKSDKIKETSAEKKKKEDDKKGEEEGQAFGGLTPTSRTATNKSGKMNAKDAADSAWETAMSGVPAEVIGTGN